MLSKPYFERIPDQSLIAGEQGKQYQYLAATRGKDFALIYNYTGRIFKVNMGKISGKKIIASWFDPKNGNKILIGQVKNKGVKKFDPPGEEKEGNDWVLMLESIDKMNK